MVVSREVNQTKERKMNVEQIVIDPETVITLTEDEANFLFYILDDIQTEWGQEYLSKVLKQAGLVINPDAVTAFSTTLSERLGRF